MHEITNGLHRLISRDFQFVHPRDSQGRLVGVVGIRAHHGVVDIVQLHGEHDADAARVPGEEPDVLFPRTVLWRSTGTAQEVVDATIALADPAPNPYQAKGCWAPDRAGHSTWLSASA